MIKIFDSQDTDFSSNGNIAIEPLSCIEIKKKSLNGWYIEVEIPIKYKEYIVQDKLCVVKTKSKISPQAFSIYDISYTTKKISFKAEHVAFRARDYFLLDCRPTSLNGDAALNYINERTDNNSPFNITSDVETISTAYFIRKNLLEAWMTIEERWNGTFDFDNYDIYFKQNIGNDNGEIISYRKNLQDFKIYEDWSNVVTKLYPTGYDGIMLPEICIESDIKYDKYYTRTISFETNLSEEEKTETNLIAELRENANIYLSENKYPKVCYEITSNIVQSVDIGDIIHVKHPLVELTTEVQEYDYDLLTKKIKKLVFGNYNRDVKTKFDNIKTNLTNIVDKVSQQSVDIDKQTKRINDLNKNGIVYIDDNEILILDSLPKETAVDVIRIGLGGLGISENGVEGPFVTAITGKGINADCITTGLIKANRIEGYSQLLLEVQSHSSSIQGLNPVLESEGNGQLSLPDCAGEKLLEFTVEGKGEQETSVQGNNILGLPEGYTWTNGNLTVSIEDGVIVFNGSTTSTGYFDIPINPVKVSGDYIYALSGEGDNLDATSFTFYTADKTAIGTYNYPYADGSQRAYKLTDIDETIEYIHVWWAANLTYNNTKFYYMLNEGTTVIPFEKFIPNSPSPDYPSEIKSKKGVENLFDINTTATPDYIVDGKISIPILTYTPVIFYYKVKANKQCAISFKNNNASSTYPIRFQIKTTDVNQNVISTIVNDTITSTGYARTFTPSTEYIRVEFFRGVETTEPTIIDEVCLKEGTFTLNYVPYGSNYLVGKVIGKNRLNIYEKSLRMQSFIDTFEILEDDWIHFANTSGSIRTYRFKEFKVEPNTPYSVFVERKEITGASPYNIWQEFDENWNAIAISYPNSSRIITTNEKTKYVLFSITSNNQNSITDYKVRNLIVKSNTIDEVYEEYKEAISLIDLKGNKLCSNKEQTVKDLLTVKDGQATLDKKIREIVLSGNEDWKMYADTQNDVLGFYAANIVSIAPENINNCLVSHFKVATNDIAPNAILSVNYPAINLLMNFIKIAIPKTLVSDVSSFKTWLSNNQVTIQYILTESKTIDLGEVSIQTVQGDCTLTLEEELDTDMYAKYIKNNPYNEAYSTRLDTKAQIQLSENKIESSVSETILQNTELIQGEIDSLSSNLANNYMTSEEVQNLNNLTNESLAVITNEFKQIQTSTQTQFQAITNILQNGVSLVKTTYITIDGDGLKIAKNTDSFNGVLDNKNLRFYSYETLMSVYSNKGAGFTNLLVTGQADIAYSKIMKVTQNGKKYTGIFYSDAMAQTLEDFIGE